MITTATEAQWKKVSKLKDQIIADQTQDIPYDEVVSIVTDIYKELGYDAPKIIQVDSPIEAKRVSRELDKEEGHKDTVTPYISLWLRVWHGWYEGAKILGVEFEQKKFDLFARWTKCCPVVFARETYCVVSKNPTECNWEDDLLHNDTGPSVKWNDGYSLWSIGGVGVDEQIVMSPHTQTLEQIDKEENVEVKRIRIDRYGWETYLENKNAEILDGPHQNEIEQNLEVLFKCDDMKVLLLTCPSTGRRYAQEVDVECMNVEEAQSYLSNGLASRIVGAS